LMQAKEAGLTEAEIGEIVAHVAINVFTNYFNIAFDTEIDFPVVRTQQAKAA
jgi:alkylhydroperoxidase family enzyme